MFAHSGLPNSPSSAQPSSTWHMMGSARKIRSIHWSLPCWRFNRYGPVSQSTSDRPKPFASMDDPVVSRRSPRINSPAHTEKLRDCPTTPGGRVKSRGCGHSSRALNPLANRSVFEVPLPHGAGSSSRCDGFRPGLDRREGLWRPSDEAERHSP